MSGRVEEGSRPRRLIARLGPTFGHDAALILITGVLAGCGLVYEYLLAHAAGRILGAVEAVIFTMIGLMIVSMGVGSLLARYFRDPFTGFAWLEGLLALLGGLSVLVMGGIIALVAVLPRVLGEIYDLPPDLIPRGGLVESLETIARIAPYVLGAILGVLVGMEIPLLARIRQSLHAHHLTHNTGTIYGADYVGAGIGAALWVLFMLAMEPARAAVLTATANLAIGLLFLLLYGRRVRLISAVLALHALVAVALIVVALQGVGWSHALEDLLYEDRVVHSIDTGHQRLTVTERLVHPARPPVHTFFINGRLQFESTDEHIYHAMLTYPPLLSAARRERVLIIGGGDGLALRDVLRWEPREVMLLDLDPRLVEFFSVPLESSGRVVNQPFLDMNRRAFADSRVETRFGDAFLTVDRLLREQRRFDVVLVDLPDPSNADLNRLYTVKFYSKLRGLLAGDGAMAVQSTSPYHARKAFLSIFKTITAAGFAHVEAYRQNVPSFGEWGWTLAVANGQPAGRRIADAISLPVDDGWSTKAILQGAFAFPKNFFSGLDDIEISRLGNAAAYRYHQQAWEREQGMVADRETSGTRP